MSSIRPGALADPAAMAIVSMVAPAIRLKTMAAIATHFHRGETGGGGNCQAFCAGG